MHTPTGHTPTPQYDYRHRGADIYDESFRIIRAEADLSRFPNDVERIVVRMCHAAGDPSIADDIAFTPGVAAAGRAALAAGAPILCDSTMVATGIIRSRLPRDNQVICLLNEPGLADLAASRGTTKTAVAVDLWAERDMLDGAVVAIGNAPTALFHLLEVLHTTTARPAAVYGIPVGFVGAAESKQALVDSPLRVEHLVVQGRRGGSAMTVAAVNATASDSER
ncbi:Precorrin-8X methylmutase [Austwickia sp. TVS 96-490-7B]|uniref:precorrin-8X methylmutase n=1 Tax=Austwickia sp. TVS 96-490-7B TaxID=2830843 RepID=UPI001C573E9E|nr:precorrin-8X methylmutase [Austwickia sp. TVS 96-490-7B]MBW3084949.1 Precorrin-8X methylmutase [Austwickia sp. TVS 96-490-7B]